MYNMRDHVAIAASNNSDGRPVIILYILSRALFDSELNWISLKINKKKTTTLEGYIVVWEENKSTWKTVQESYQASSPIVTKNTEADVKDAYILRQKKIEQQRKNGVLYLIAKLRTSWHNKNKIEIQIAMLNLGDQWWSQGNDD